MVSTTGSGTGYVMSVSGGRWMQVLPVPGHISRLALSENNYFISWKNGLICVEDSLLERIGEWPLKK